MFIISILFGYMSYASFTTEPQTKHFMSIQGQYEPGKNGLDRIKIGRLVYIIKNENIIQNNKTDLKGLLERKIFKIKPSYIQSIELGSL